MKIITNSQRLFLREFEVNDAVHFYKLNLNPEVIKYTGDPPFSSVEEAKKFILNYTAYKEYGYGRWAVCLKKNSNFIGFCGLKYHPKERITEVGYRFFKKHWNQGYATESVLSCLEYGFSKLNLEEIYAHVHISNEASHRVVEKCGLHFVKEFLYDNNPAKLYCLKNPSNI